MDQQPPGLIVFSFFVWLSAVDPDAVCVAKYFWAGILLISLQPVIFSFVLYHGSQQDLNGFSPPFDGILSPEPFDARLVDFTELASLTGNGYDGLACGHGSVSQRFPIGTSKYNIKAQRAAYNEFAKVTSEIPALNGSFFLFEGYSTPGVKDVPDENTAFLHRQDNLLM